MKTAASLVAIALIVPQLSGQVSHPDSQYFADQAAMIGLTVHPTRENGNEGNLDRSDMAIVRLGVLLCTQLYPADSTAGRARCFRAMQGALTSVLIRVGPCSKSVRVNREGSRECWRLVNDTWTWYPMFAGDSAGH